MCWSCSTQKFYKFVFLQIQFSRTIRCLDGRVSQIPSRFVRMKDLEFCPGEHSMGKNIHALWMEW